jgi:hypothetical protein
VSPPLLGYSDLAIAAILVVLNAVLTWMFDLALPEPFSSRACA